MCTVTYFPNTRGFILTHNRDEAPNRSPEALTRMKYRHRTLLFPRDTKANGTWIICANTGQTACLLNGAFEKHVHTPPYRRSRGMLLLDSLQAENPDTFWAAYDYAGIEPFTLLLFSRQLVQEIRWDGARQYHKNLPIGEPHFWSSSTLYTRDMQERREQVFRRWLQSGVRRGAEALLSLHRTGSINDPENDYVMNRNHRVQTVSITQVVHQSQCIRMRYFDLLKERQDVRSITLKPEIDPFNT